MKPTPTYENGEYVKDIVSARHPDEDANIMVIVNVLRGTSPDTFIVDEDTGETLDSIVDNWPPTDGQERIDDEFVVQTVFMADLDRRFGGAWVTWSTEKLRRLCDINNVTVYSYHASRLMPASPMKFPPRE